MATIIIDGGLGSGKTLMATIISVLDKAKRPILANYTINVERARIVQPQELAEINDPTVVVLDEGYTWLESRTSGKDINRYLSYILFQSRKRGIDFVITVQLLSSIDLRFKGLADIYIHSKRYPNGFLYQIFPSDPDRQASYLFLSNEKAAKFWPLYSTYEKVDPIDNALLFKVTPKKSELMKGVNELVDKMVQDEGIAAEQWTKGMIEDYCLRNNIQTYNVPMMFNRIKVMLAKEDMPSKERIKKERNKKV